MKSRVLRGKNGVFAPDAQRNLLRAIGLGTMMSCCLAAAFLGCSGAPSEDLDWVSLKSEIRATFPEVRQLSTAALEDWITAEGRVPPLILDARTAEEYEVSHLAGAVLARSVEEAHLRLKGIGKDHPIVVYCSVGYRSSLLAEELQNEGCLRVYNLEGSIFQWANEGRPVFKDGQKVDRVHPYDDQWGRFLDRRLWGY